MYIVFNQARKQIFFRLFFLHLDREREQTNWVKLIEWEREKERDSELVGTFISHLVHVMKYTGMSLSEEKRKQRDDVTIIIMNSMALIVHDWLQYMSDFQLNFLPNFARNPVNA